MVDRELLEAIRQMMDEGFAAVDAKFAEQDQKMDAKLAEQAKVTSQMMDEKLAEQAKVTSQMMDEKLAEQTQKMDARFAAVDAKFEAVDAKFAEQRKATVSDMKLLLDTEVRTQFNLLAEGQEAILRMLPSEDDMDITDDRIASLEAIVKKHTRELEKLKKAN